MSEGGGRTRIAVGAGVAVVCAGLAAYLLFNRKPAPATGASTAPSASSSAPADEADAVARREARRAKREKSRAARDAMRREILEALKKRGADPAPPPPVREALKTPPQEGKPRGHYEADYIRGVMKEDMFPLLKSCYEGALRKNPKLDGKLILDFTITGDPDVGGVVEDADFDESSSIQDDEMRTCVRESLMTITFDKPPSGGGFVTVKYPIAFSPGDEPPEATSAGGAQADGGAAMAPPP